MKTLDDIRQRSAQFAADRDWQTLQSPKNLAMALSVEVAELLELFQWLTEQESRQLDPQLKARAADEIADVQLYLVRLADELGIDILAAVDNKADKNDKKYPIERVRSRVKKTTQ